MPYQKDPCGLINQGMTCYLNAVLQVLFMTDKFRDHVLSTPPEKKLLQALAELFRSLMKEQTAVSTTEVAKSLNITNVSEQKDAAECLQMILHRVPEKVSEIFRGIMVTTTKCCAKDCTKNYPAETPFLSIPLSIEGQCDVKCVLEEYLGVHDMSGDDQLYCVECKTMRNMKTSNCIKVHPDILTLQLKRFETDGYYFRKNDYKVQIPSRIQGNLGNYELYAAINHHGTYFGGHYDAIIKHKSGDWYHFNDNKVTKLYRSGPQEINDSSSSAYLLMYRKEEAASGQIETAMDTACRPKTRDDRRFQAADHGIVHRMLEKSEKDSERNNLKSNVPKNPDGADVKSKQSMISPKSSIESQSSVSSSKIKFKLKLKNEFQFLNKEISPGERQKLDEIFIERHIKEEPHLRISVQREIMCNNIFESQKIRTVLMKGDAGIGKTVTVQKFILDWATENSNNDIEYIFPMPFQKLNVIREMVGECNFLELIQQSFENTEHLKLDSDKVMLIFDGLNELNLPLDFQNTKSITDLKESASVSDLLSNLIMGNLLPNAQIWITSRPAAANQIPSRFIDRVTEIQGFDDQQKKEYFKKNISEQRITDVIRYIETSSRFNSMCYLPDYCRIVAAISAENSRKGHVDFPKTLTQMYGKLLLAQIKPIRDRKETILALGKTAFLLLVNGNSLLSAEDLKKCGFRDERVLTNSSIIKVIEDKRSYCFMNRRTQEFLAALYVTWINNEEIPLELKDLSGQKFEFVKESLTDYNSLQKVIENALQRQMDLFFCFLLGLTLESSQRVLEDLLKQRSSSSSSSQHTVQHIRAMIMNFSPQNADKCSLLFDALKELDECSTVQEIKTMFVLLNSEEQLDETKSHRSEEHPLKLPQVVKTFGELKVHQCEVSVEDCAVLRSNLSYLKEVDLSENAITDSGINQLSALLKDAQCKLEKLLLRSCHIKEGGCKVLALALRSNPSHLRELDLSDNYIKDSGVKLLSGLLKHPQCELQKLWLRSCHINEEGCAELSTALRLNPSHLRELDLGDNCIKESAVKHLSDLLKHPQCKLEKLRLRSCWISDGGCAELSKALRSNPYHLRELDLRDNDIKESGIQQLSALMADSQCKLEKAGLKLENTKYGVLRSNKMRVNWSETADLVTGIKNLNLN